MHSARSRTWPGIFFFYQAIKRGMPGCSRPLLLEVSPYSIDRCNGTAIEGKPPLPSFFFLINNPNLWSAPANPRPDSPKIEEIEQERQIGHIRRRIPSGKPRWPPLLSNIPIAAPRRKGGWTLIALSTGEFVASYNKREDTFSSWRVSELSYDRIDQLIECGSRSNVRLLSTPVDQYKSIVAKGCWYLTK